MVALNFLDNGTLLIYRFISVCYNKFMKRNRFLIRFASAASVPILSLFFGGCVLLNSGAGSQSGMMPRVDRSVGDYEKVAYQPVTEDEKNTITVFGSVQHAVVHISTQQIERRLFRYRVNAAIGSGSVIRKGKILTNYHVVENALSITVTFFDGTETQAQIVGADPENDLALLSFNVEAFQADHIEFGESASLVSGQKVIAVGSPYGFERTVTTGVISGTRRTLLAESGYIILKHGTDRCSD